MKKIAPTEGPSKPNDTNPTDFEKAPPPPADSGVGLPPAKDAADTRPSTPTDPSAELPKASGSNARGALNAASANRFDPSRLRLSTDFISLAGAKKHLVAVQIRKPHKTEWVQFHASEVWRGEFAILALHDEMQPYVLTPELYAEHSRVAAPTLLVTTVNTAGDVFLTPIGLPGPDGRQHDAHRSLMSCAELGMQGRWVRIEWNKSAKQYDILSAVGDFGPATWPDMTFEALLEIALRDRLIDDRDHPILKRLRGEG